jgi:hypothetical protein
MTPPVERMIGELDAFTARWAADDRMGLVLAPLLLSVTTAVLARRGALAAPAVGKALAQLEAAVVALNRALTEARQPPAVH